MSASSQPLPEPAQFFPAGKSRVYRWRFIKDRLAKRVIALGGGSVIVAIALIFCYLFYEVLPLFQSAKMALTSTQAVSFANFDSNQSRQWSQSGLDELGEVLFYRDQNGFQFVRQSDGHVIDSGAYPEDVALILSESGTDLSYAQVSHDHQLTLYKVKFDVRFPVGGERYVQPSIQALNEEPLALSLPDSAQLVTGTFRLLDGQLVWLSWVNASSSTVPGIESGQLILQRWSIEESLFGEGVEFEALDTQYLRAPAQGIQKLFLSPDLRWAYAIEADGAAVSIFDLNPAQNFKTYRYSVTGDTITSSALLLGGQSLLLGDAGGVVSQLSRVRNEDNSYQFVVFREFELSASPIVFIESEQRRKGFLALDTQGELFLANTTAHRVALQYALPSDQMLPVLSPRADSLASINSEGVAYFSIDNHHPEISWKSLWQKVWYEGYSEPKYLWQSSAANNDFEPKLSLVPLTLGTLKAAFYAMLLAMPLAICSAVYTAYFMAPAFRRKVKPTIELMEALPTVILGFLAGLWLAPLIEAYLPGVFLFLLVTPVMFLVAAYVFSVLLKNKAGLRIPAGWEALSLVPILIISVLLCFYFSNPLQDVFFGGDVRIWIEQDLGITYDQRNALVIGFAMGFAVIPTIFSITEDAVFSVPKSLTQSSLALGASTWQTLVRVVIPTASPGIFSGVMIGFGRAVGETMIVLMATGNTPVMNFNIFEGFRTLSANIAVELPEAEVHSTHFRVLFLSALVLFVFTFVINTLAEFVRQRLREKYGSL